MTETTNAGGSGAGNNTGGSGNNEQNSGGTAEQQPLSFDSWITEQPDPVKSLLDGHTRGLKSALDSEREARKGMEKQIKDLAAKAEKGSDLERQLTELVNQQNAAEVRAAFYEEAHSVGISNLKLAYIVASQEGMIDQKGRVNWEGLKKGYPELFAATIKPAPGNAGSGTGSAPGQKSANQIMNDFILRGGRKE